MRRLAIAFLLLGCSAPEPTGHLGIGELGTAEPSTEAAALPSQGAPPSDERDVFGAAPDEGLPLTSLAAIVEAPDTYRDQVVRTEGQIARVCQRMGCWMELRDGEDGPAVRVPMAGHAFFLPRDAAGRHATMQGRVAIRELTPAARAHLESEGAVATRDALSIEATGVVID